MSDAMMYYQERIEFWKSADLESNTPEDNALCQKMLKQYEVLNAQFHTVMHKFFEVGNGLILRNERRSMFAMLLPDASTPGSFRYQGFDEQGFFTHVTKSSSEEAVLSAFQDGFRYVEENQNLLNELSQQPRWQRGMQAMTLLNDVSLGKLTLEEANKQFKAA